MRIASRSAHTFASRLDRALRERRRALLERDRVDRADPRQPCLERQLEPGRQCGSLGHELSLVRAVSADTMSAGRNEGYPDRDAEDDRGSRRRGGDLASFRRPPAEPRRDRRAQSTGFSDTAETVMGTLTAPPNRRFLTRIRNGKMGGVVLPRQRLAHPPHRSHGHGRAPAGRVHARRAAPDRRRPGRRDRQAPRLGAADRGARPR